jgi:hypothetical protein
MPWFIQRERCNHVVSLLLSWAPPPNLVRASRIRFYLSPHICQTGMDTFGKTLTIVWQIFLVCGPLLPLVRWFCSRVRSITTDMGVERNIANHVDLLTEMYFGLDPKCAQASVTNSQMWQFPRALKMPGWKHCWDLMVRKGLTSLRFFPDWILKFKAVVSFLRNQNLLLDLCRSLQAQGFEGVAEMLRKASFPKLAEWRWGTLEASCEALDNVLMTLLAHFDPEVFANWVDRTSLREVTLALTSAQWLSCFYFTMWFCKWLGRIMRWGTGCSCHEAELLSGQEVHCDRKGRRLKDAHRWASESLKQGLDEANTWTANSFRGISQDLLAAFQGCVRGVHHVSMQKISFLTRIPYLFGQLRVPGVKKLCVDQWLESPASSHHRVSRQFMESGRALTFTKFDNWDNTANSYFNVVFVFDQIWYARWRTRGFFDSVATRWKTQFLHNARTPKVVLVCYLQNTNPFGDTCASFYGEVLPILCLIHMVSVVVSWTGPKAGCVI